MMTVKEVSKRTGVSIRTLHYYDEIGLLRPTSITESGYRLYDDRALERLSHILLFRDLEFSLKEIGQILTSPDFDYSKALDQQIHLLMLKRKRLDGLIHFARELKKTGVHNMSFKAFDKQKIEAYSKQAKAQWGHTDAWKECEAKNAGRSDADFADINAGLMAIFSGFGQLMDREPGQEAVQAQVGKLQDYITAHYYHCTKPILAGLGQMYRTEEFTENIDRAGGTGCAEFAAQAIEIYCK